MLGAVALPSIGGIDVAKFAGVPGVAPKASANELSGNQYEDVTSENVSPMANIQELFMEMAYDLKSIAINTFETNEILRDAAPSGADMRDIGIGEEDRGEDDEDKEDKKEKSGILSSLAGVFKGLDMGFGDKMKMLLFGTILLGITKYADQIIPPLAKVLTYLKDTLFPALEKLFDVVDDDTGEIKWSKILGLSLAAYVATKIGPLLLSGLVFKVGGSLTLGKFVKAGKAFGPIGLALWATASAFQAVGDWNAAKDWTEDMGATDNETLNKISGALGGSLEGGIMNAFKNASKFAGAGALTGLALGGPVGALIGGLLGAAFGGVLGFIGGGKIAQGLEAMVDGVNNMWNTVTQSITDIFYDREIADGPAGATRTQRSKVGEIYDRAAAIGDSLLGWVNDTWEYLTGWIPSVDDLKEYGYNMGTFINDTVNDLKKFVFDGSIPQFMGIDLSKMADALPSIDEIKQNIIDMLPDFMKPKSEAEKQQVKDLSEAEESGLFDKDYVGKSEIERDMVKDAPTSHLKSILALESDDLRKSDIQFIENELASRGEDLTKVEDDVVIEDTATNKVGIETDEGAGAGNPYGTANIVTTQDNSVKAKTDNTYIGQGNSAYGSDTNAWASMGYGGGSKYWGSI
jgi:hypothetical protein